MWWQIGLFLVSLALAYLFRPKPEVSKPPPVEDFDISTAEDGATINVLFGTRNIKNHNVVWWGDSGSREFKVSGGESTWLVDIEDVHGGYYYYVSLHSALCIGPIDLILQIIVDEKTVWIGSHSGGQFYITDAKEIFGGKTGGGGIGGSNIYGDPTPPADGSGSVYLETGELDQVQNTYLQSVLGTDIPAFRGVCCFLAQQLYIGTSPYLRQFEFRAQRIYKSTDGAVQWYPEKAAIPICGGQIYYPTAVENLDISIMIEGGYANSFNFTRIKAAAIELAAYMRDEIYPNIEDLQGVSFKVYSFHSSGASGLGGCGTPDASFVSYKGDSLWDYSWGVFWTDLNNWCLDRRPANTPDYYVSQDYAHIEPSFGSHIGDYNNLRIGMLIGAGHPCDVVEYIDNADCIDDAQNLPEVSLQSGVTALETLVASSSSFKIHAISANEGSEDVDLDVLEQIDFHTPDGYDLKALNDDDGYTPLRQIVDYHVFGYDFDGEVVGADLNPAHLIRECLTDTNWGMGYSSDDIDSTSFTAAADSLYDEGLGISIEWTQQSSLWDFIGIIKKHIDAELYVNRSTGKFELHLIRDDYDPDALTVLDEDNIVSVENVSRPALGELVNSVTVQYWDSCNSMNDASVTVTDQALIDLQGGEINTTIQYPGITTHNNAAKIATRDLRTLSSPLLSATIYANRDSGDFYPGDVFVLDWPDLGIDRVICRVKEIDLGDGINNTIRISAVEDVFALPETVVNVPDENDPVWVNPVQPPEAITYQIAGEMPYHALLKVIGKTDLDAALTSDDDAGWVYAAAVRPGNSIDAEMHTDDGSGYEEVDTLQYCGSCLLTAVVSQTDTAWTWDGGTDMGLVAVGMWGQIDDEIIAVSAIDTDAGTMTVLRGVMDTEPRTHADDSRVYFWNGYRGYDRNRRQDADSIDVKLLSRTGSGILAIADASAETVVLDERADRPYPPGDLQIDGTPYPTPAVISAASFDVTWEHRDRLTQTALLDHTDTSISTAEAGTTYTVQVYDDNPTLQIEHTGISGKSQTVTMSGEAAGDYTLQVWAVRDSKNSWQCAEYDFEYIIPVTGTGAGTLQQITGDGSGVAYAQVTGTGAGTLPKITGSGGNVISGTGAGTLQSITGTGHNFLVKDAFTDSDGTNILSHTPDIDLEGGGYTLIVSAGSPTMGIYSNKVQTTDTSYTNYGSLSIDSGYADVSMSCEMKRPSNYSTYGSGSLIFRITSSTAYWWAGMHLSASTLTIFEKNPTSVARATSSCTWAGGATKTMTATTSGNTITAWVDGASEVSYASATLNNTVTVHGLAVGSQSSDPIVYDNFIISL